MTIPLIVREHWISDVLGELNKNLISLNKGTPSVQAWAAGMSSSGLSLRDFTQRIASHFHIGVADLGTADLRILKLVPEKTARRYLVFPLSEDDKNIYVATSDPMNFEMEQAVTFASGRSPVFRVAAPDAILHEIDRRYSPEKIIEDVLAHSDSDISYVVRVLDDSEPEAMGLNDIEAAPVVKLTNLIIRDAIRQNASDIHIEPSRSTGNVRFRVDGVMRTYRELPLSAMNRVISRIKVLARLDFSDRTRPQDGRTRIQVEHRPYDLRISTVPTRDYEKAVIRILDPSGARTLDDLAIPEEDLRRLRGLLSNREGIILVTGPTGSGKTTTLYAALRELANGKVNITTVEDPVEYELAGLTQIQVDTKRGVTFATALRSIVRQDPDVIFVGEIRDVETAKMAVQASMTGHLVLSTLHTNDAVGAIGRLADLGVDRASIAATLRGVVAQRLVRRICTKCGETIGADYLPEEERLSAAYGLRPKVRAKGCADCQQSGYRGRIPLHEIFVMNMQLQDAIPRGATMPEIQQMAISAGMKSMLSAGLIRAAAGETTIEELDRVLGDTGEMPAPAPTATPAPTAIPDLPRILIVDDDAISRRVARSIMENQGYKVSESVDGVAGLEAVAQNGPFNLIILDLSMPRLGGREVLARLKGSAATSNIPVIVLTEYARNDVEAELINEGADDYMRKPLDPMRFSARVKAVLRRAAAQ